jgi:hypothetical protein
VFGKLSSLNNLLSYPVRFTGHSGGLDTRLPAKVPAQARRSVENPSNAPSALTGIIIKFKED